MRGKKRVLMWFAAAVLCLFATACGTATGPETTPAETAPAETLVMASVGAGKWLSSAVEDYNAAGTEKFVELVRFASEDELFRALDEGFDADMYYLGSPGNRTGEATKLLWDLSADLSGQLDVELAPNLAEALMKDGELRCLPFDMRSEGLRWTLSDELPGSMAEAASLASKQSMSLFSGAMTQYGAVQRLFPYLNACDEAARGEILDAVSAHVMGDTNGAYNFYAADGGAEFSFDTGAGAIGVPGSGTTAYYAPETVFGVFEGCEDVGAAWDFLRLLYSDEIQAKTSSLPVTASALDAYIDEELDEESAPAFRELLENTRAAVGVNTVMDETRWYTDWYNANAVENT